MQSGSLPSSGNYSLAYGSLARSGFFICDERSKSQIEAVKSKTQISVIKIIGVGTVHIGPIPGLMLFSWQGGALGTASPQVIPS